MLNEDRMLSLSHRSMSCTSYRHHQTIPTRSSFIFMEFCLFFTFSFYYFLIVDQIIKQKNEKRKEILKLIHIEPLINYLSLALTYFCILTLNSFSITGNNHFITFPFIPLSVFRY
jgi:hypothetical protein